MNIALDHGLAKLFTRLHVFDPAAFLDCLASIDEHDDAGFSRHPKSGDEAHPHGHAEIHWRRVPALENDEARTTFERSLYPRLSTARRYLAVGLSDAARRPTAVLELLRFLGYAASVDYDL
jgi:hypothetical protein